MSFERRLVDIVLFVIVAALLIGGIIAFGISFSKVSDDSAFLVVKSLNPVQAAPKVSYIPVKRKSAIKANISNSILSTRAKKPVVITI